MYQLLENSNGIRRNDGAYIPNDLANRDWVAYQEWLAAGNTPEPVPVEMPTAAQVQAQYIAALDAHLDATARARGYDTKYTCALRAGYPGPFQAEGQAFAVWMDSCYLHGRAILRTVQAGERKLPSIDEFVSELPQMVWPLV